MENQGSKRKRRIEEINSRLPVFGQKTALNLRTDTANPYLSAIIPYISNNIPLLLQHVAIGVINKQQKYMNGNLSEQDVLLVRGQGGGELHVAGMDAAGKVSSNKLNSDVHSPDFLKIDRHGNMLENFFANFSRQR